MSIYARKYKPSKWEPIVFADKLDDMFADFAARDFGIKNMNRLVRSQYVTHRFNDDDYAFYFAILNEHKRHVRENVNLLTRHVRLANVYPTTQQDVEERINHQSQAIFACVLLSKELKQIARRFDVDLNKFEVFQDGIDREIKLIKRWKQRDSRLARQIKQQRKHMIELFERLFNKQVRIHKHKMIITETA